MIKTQAKLIALSALSVLTFHMQGAPEIPAKSKGSTQTPVTVHNYLPDKGIIATTLYTKGRVAGVGTPALAVGNNHSNKLTWTYIAPGAHAQLSRPENLYTIDRDVVVFADDKQGIESLRAIIDAIGTSDEANLPKETAENVGSLIDNVYVGQQPGKNVKTYNKMTLATSGIKQPAKTMSQIQSKSLSTSQLQKLAEGSGLIKDKISALMQKPSAPQPPAPSAAKTYNLFDNFNKLPKDL